MSSLTFGRRGRRRRRFGVALGLMIALVGVVFGWGGPRDRDTSAAGERAPGTDADAAPAPTDAAADAAPAPMAQQDAEGADAATPALGRLGDLPIFLPSPEPVIVGFHEAATVSALAVTPVGSLTEDRNTTRTDLPEDVAGGTPYLVLSSRGRSAGPTSAMDVVLAPGEPVLAPVTGTVVDVRGYLLYGAHQDLRIELVPDDRPDVRVVMIHVDAAEVAIGDRVTGGVTPVAATARLFPFSSHIDRETEPERFPHVHIELQPVDAPRPGDPADEAATTASGDADETDATAG